MNFYPQVLKICCNHFITGELDLKPMSNADGKAWVWYALDFTEGEGQMEQLAIKFRDAETANEFKRVFDESREKMKTPSKVDAALMTPTPGKSPAVSRKLFTPENGESLVLYPHYAVDATILVSAALFECVCALSTNRTLEVTN